MISSFSMVFIQTAKNVRSKIIWTNSILEFAWNNSSKECQCDMIKVRFPDPKPIEKSE